MPNLLKLAVSSRIKNPLLVLPVCELSVNLLPSVLVNAKAGPMPAPEISINLVNAAPADTLLFTLPRPRLPLISRVIRYALSLSLKNSKPVLSIPILQSSIAVPLNFIYVSEEPPAIYSFLAGRLVPMPTLPFCWIVNLVNPDDDAVNRSPLPLLSTTNPAKEVLPETEAICTVPVPPTRFNPPKILEPPTTERPLNS